VADSGIRNGCGTVGDIEGAAHRESSP
jgi:hypothetical protein